jgi:hypothetical protein
MRYWLERLTWTGILFLAAGCFWWPQVLAVRLRYKYAVRTVVPVFNLPDHLFRHVRELTTSLFGKKFYDDHWYTLWIAHRLFLLALFLLLLFVVSGILCKRRDWVVRYARCQAGKASHSDSDQT